MFAWIIALGTSHARSVLRRVLRGLRSGRRLGRCILPDCNAVHKRRNDRCRRLAASAHRRLACPANGMKTIMMCSPLALWLAASSRPTHRQSGHRGCGHWPLGITKIERPHMAMPRPERPRWQRSPRVGDGNDSRQTRPSRGIGRLLSVRSISVRHVFLCALCFTTFAPRIEQSTIHCIADIGGWQR
jgi:hypothetical protein